MFLFDFSARYIARERISLSFNYLTISCEGKSDNAPSVRLRQVPQLQFTDFICCSSHHRLSQLSSENLRIFSVFTRSMQLASILTEAQTAAQAHHVSESSTSYQLCCALHQKSFMKKKTEHHHWSIRPAVRYLAWPGPDKYNLRDGGNVAASRAEPVRARETRTVTAMLELPGLSASRNCGPSASSC